MSEKRKFQLSWLFIAVAMLSGTLLLQGWSPAGASDDHEEVRDLRNKGEIIPLSILIKNAELENMKILEVELEREHGQMVYELEILDAEGRVHERYYNAVTGEPLNGLRED